MDSASVLLEIQCVFSEESHGLMGLAAIDRGSIIHHVMFFIFIY